MRYRLDANGYVESVFWGCYSNGCAEYTGTIPNGYTDLNDWSENALINAYYIDENGNLVLDTERLKELEAKIEQDSIDNEPLLRKDLYGTSDVLDSQYQSKTAKGNVLVLTNVKKINPNIKNSNGKAIIAVKAAEYIITGFEGYVAVDSKGFMFKFKTVLLII